MLTRVFLLCALLAFGMAAGQPAGEPLPALDSRTVQLLPPNAAFVFGVRWRRLVESGFFDQIKAQVAQQTMSAFPGFGPIEEILLKNIDSVVFAGSADAIQRMKPAAPGAAKRNAPVLVVIKGRFNLASLRALAGETKGATETYQEVELLRVAGMKPATTRWAMVDGSTLIAGDRRELVRAIDRRRLPEAAPVSGVVSRAGRLAAQNDVWMAMQVPPTTGAAASTPAEQMMREVQALDLGMSFANGMALNANLRTRTGESAQGLAAALQAMLALASQGQGQPPEVADLAKRLRIQPEGSNVNLALALSKTEMDRLVAARMQAGMKPAATAGAPMARPPEPPGPKSIRITGLDSGPLEIPVAGTSK